MKRIKAFARDAMGTKQVRIETDVNKKVFSKGIEKIPFKIRVRIERTKTDDDESDEYISIVSLVPVEQGGFKGLLNETVQE